jgi:hypothetical protein
MPRRSLRRDKHSGNASSCRRLDPGRRPAPGAERLAPGGRHPSARGVDLARDEADEGGPELGVDPAVHRVAAAAGVVVDRPGRDLRTQDGDERAPISADPLQELVEGEAVLGTRGKDSCRR